MHVDAHRLRSPRPRLSAFAPGEAGFTLVELLVVILIVAILAAIAIPSFLNQKGRGEDAAAKSAAHEAATAEETYYTDTAGYTTSVAALQAIEDTLPTAGTNPGDLDVSSYQPIVTALPLVVISFATFAWLARPLNLLSLGDESAETRGA